MKLQGNFRLIDVANITGTSIATVSRYLNGKSIRPDSQAKLEAFFRKHEMTDVIIDADARGSAKSVGLIVPDCNSNTFSSITNGIIDAANELGYTVISTYSQGQHSTEQQLLRALSNIELKGLLFSSIGVNNASVYPMLKRFANIPVVVIWRRNTNEPYSHVYSDNIMAGYHATKYLLNLGRRNIGIILGSWRNIDLEEMYEHYADYDKFSGLIGIDRFRGYRLALEEYHIPFAPELVVTSNWRYESAALASSKLLQTATHIDGILASSDLLGAVASRVLTSHGYRIPEDISIISWGNSAYATVTTPTLTCVEEQTYQAGQAALRLLDEQIHGAPMRDVKLDTTIIPRNSTAVKTAT